MAEGVDIVLDQYDLKEGHDKNAFMEKMVTDPSVTHALVICDKVYAEKADARKAGVGTESQIISQEVYNKVEQSKFIPVLCEFSETGEPHLPTFMKSRIGVNFSTPELVNDNWEQLVRLLFGKPLFQKPILGKPPIYISENKPAPSNPALSRFAAFKQAFVQGRKGLASYRNDFLTSCFQYVDTLRVRTKPQGGDFNERVLSDAGKLVQVRDLLVDWVMMEGSTQDNAQFEDSFSSTLEKLLELRSRPKEVTTWSDHWFEAHRLFVYETFLYCIAALLKSGAFTTLKEVFNSGYLRPQTDSYGGNDHFVNFSAFWAQSETLNTLLSPPGKRLLSPAAELIKRQATREDLPFENIMEAELLVMVAATLNETARWYPQTLFYAGYDRMFSLFLRATQHKHFKKLAIITGVQTADELRSKVKAGLERLKVEQWTDLTWHANVSIWNAANMDKLGTIN